ncbi:hypothetical protein D3C71_697760 [compost metagenome]
MKTILLLSTLLLCLIARSQNGLTEYFDSEQERGTVRETIIYQDKLIFVGSSFENKMIPAMICVDTNGVVLWNTAINDATSYDFSYELSNQQYKLFLGTDGFVYSCGLKNQIPEYWKVDPSNGQIVWKKTINNPYQIETLIDYDANQFLICYSSSYNGFNYVRKLCLVNKSDGSLNTLRTLSNSNSASVVKDTANDIYYSNNDSIIKLDASNQFSTLWQVKYSPVNLSGFTNLYYNSVDSSLVCLAIRSSNNQHYALRINSSNGILISNLALGIGGNKVSQLKVKSGFLYASFQHTGVGAGNYLSILKFNLSLYSISWFSNIHLSNGNQAIQSFDLDDENNVFYTGYYQSSNYGPGKWFIQKLDSTGTLVYTQYIDRITPASSEFSEGVSTIVIDNKPCIIGSLDGEFNKGFSNNCLVRLNNQTGEIEKKTTVEGRSVNFDSRVIDVIEYQGDKLLVLIKRGRIGQLICYSSTNIELWRTNFSSSDGIVPYNLASTSDGNIWVSAQVFGFNSVPPYFASTPNDLYVYKISSSGAILNTFEDYNLYNDYLPQEFMIQGDDAHLIYRSNSSVKMKNYATYGAEQSLGYTILLKQNNNFFTPGTSTLGVVSGNISGLPVIKNYSAGSGFVSTKTLNFVGSTIHCATKLDLNNTIVGGRASGSKAMVFRFNNTVNDTLWRYVESATGTETVIKIAIADNKQSCYLLSNTSSNIVIRKLKTSNGNLIWKKIYNGALNNTDEGLDIAFDSIRQQILIVGYETYLNSSNRVPLVLKLDTLGTFLDTLIVNNGQSYLNGSFNKVKIRSNGSVVVGGRYYSPTVGNCGMINIINNPVQHIYENISSCTSYTWPINNVSYLLSGTYSYYSSANEDTLYHLILNINQSSSISNFVNSCYSYVWPLTGQTYTSSGQYVDTISNVVGCDSIITLNLTILSPSSSTETVTSCDIFIWPVNGQSYTSSGQYIDTIPNTAGCDSIITLNLTILNSSTGTETQTACGSFIWPINGQTYTTSGLYTDTIPNAVSCDSIITLDLTIIPDLPLTIENTFSMPSDANSCVGEVVIDVSGNADFELDIDNGSKVITSSGYSLVTNLCAGMHDLHVTDNCGDTLTTQIVIPVDSNYVFNNPFIDSLAIDSLGVTMTNCDIFYNGIDTAYIDSIWANGNTVNVIWNIVDPNGSNFDTTTYVLNNGNGVYWLQLSVFCPNKSIGEYFTVTEAIYFNNGSVSTAGLSNYKQALFEVYPNPTNNNVHINFSGPDAELTVYDLQGKVVLKDQIQNQGTVSLENFERGVYLFDFKNSLGQSVQRVVKQ